MTDSRIPARIWIIVLDRFEQRLRVKAARDRNAFLRQSAEAYEQNGTFPAWLTEWHRRRITGTLTRHYEQVAPHFATMTRRQIRRQQKQTGRFLALMTEWVAREALRKAKLIAATDTEVVRDAIEDGIVEGLSSAAIARNIRRASEQSPARAFLIARTETHAAATFGSIESVREAEQDLGVRMLKQWVPTEDERTRPEHAAMADVEPIPLDEKFLVGGVPMDRPGDPSAPIHLLAQCRCTLVYTEST